MLLGAYLTYNVRNTLGPAVLCSRSLGWPCSATALVGAVVERLVLRRMVGQPVFAVIMITIGLLFIIEQVDHVDLGLRRAATSATRGASRRSRSATSFIARADLWTLAHRRRSCSPAFFAFFRFTRLGVAMRATALDQEAALAQGISARTGLRAVVGDRRRASPRWPA